MNGIEGATAASYLNSILASSFANPRSAQAAQSARIADMNLRADAARAAAQAGPGATTNIQYQYSTGPDGQLYATGATISSSRRTRGADQLLPPELQRAPSAQPILEDARPRRFGDVQPVRPLLSPADEAAIFGSPEFLEDVQSGDSIRRARLQLADFGVRAQESQHFYAAAGLGSAPTYEYEVGPDGELFAVAGSVTIQPGTATSEEEAARDAATIANAALAATDVSAQDIAVARDAQSRAASLYARNFNITENPYLAQYSSFRRKPESPSED